MHHEDIKAAIRKKGVTPADLAKHLEVTDSTVSGVIRGVIRSERVAGAIAGLLGESVDTLWPGSYTPRADGAKTVAALLKRAPKRTRAAA